jgi:hypothetical protein
MKRILKYKVTLTWNSISEQDEAIAQQILNDPLTPEEVREVMEHRLIELFEEVPEEPMRVKVTLIGDHKEKV